MKLGVLDLINEVLQNNLGGYKQKKSRSDQSNRDLGEI